MLNKSKKVELPEEALVQLFVNGDFLSALLCTPRDLTELALGWLYNQGCIESVDEVVSVDACERNREIHVELTAGRHREAARQGTIRTSACVGGEISYFQFSRKKNRLIQGPTLALEVVQDLMKRSLASAEEYRKTGGIHCASLASAGQERIVAFYEDIGRHNALDKVVGSMLLRQQDKDDKLLLTSGRISSEMALKAIHSGISVIATVTTCTDLAVEVAEEAGLTIVVRALGTPRVLCGRHRIRFSDLPAPSTLRRRMECRRSS